METTSVEKQIKEIEDEIFNTQKNKATEHHIGKLNTVCSHGYKEGRYSEALLFKRQF